MSGLSDMMDCMEFKPAPLVVIEPVRIDSRGLRRGDLLDSPAGHLLVLRVDYRHPSAGGVTRVSGIYVTHHGREKMMALEDRIVTVLPDIRESLELKISNRERAQRQDDENSPLGALRQRGYDLRLGELAELRAALCQLS